MAWKWPDRLDFEKFTLLYLSNAETGFELELTVNKGRQEAYELGDGYGHLAFSVEDVDAEHKRLTDAGLSPRKLVDFAPAGEVDRPLLSSSRIPMATRSRCFSAAGATSRSHLAMAWYSSLGLMSVAAATRLDMLKKAATGSDVPDVAIGKAGVPQALAVDFLDRAGPLGQF